jgi:hypothetical protein
VKRLQRSRRDLVDRRKADLIATQIDMQRGSIPYRYGAASYRLKVQRLEDSARSRGVTLQSVVQDDLAEREWSTRSEILERFEYDEDLGARWAVEGRVIVRHAMG